MADDTNFGMGSVNPYLGKDNPYLQQIIDSASGDLVKNFNQATRPALNAAMVKSGSFGNSALGELDQSAQSDLQKNLGDLSSKLRFNDYTQQQQMYQWDQGFGRDLYNDAYGQNQQNLQTGLGLLDFLQRTNANDIGTTTTRQNTPLNYWQQFSQGANSIGQGYGTSTGTQGTTSNPLATAMGGAQLGSSAMNWWNNRGSSPISSSSTSADSGSWWTA